MLRQRSHLPVLLLSMAMIATPARSEDRGAAGLSIIPADAMAFVCVPNLAELDTAYQQAVNDLGLQAFLPPPKNSIVDMLKQTLPMLAGIDEDGPVALVVMPGDSLDALSANTALLIPAKDPKAMLEQLRAMSMAMSGQVQQGEPAPIGEDQVISINLMGTPAHGGVTDSHMVVAMSTEVAKAVVGGKGGITSRLAKTDVAALSGLKLAVWADAASVIKLARPQIDGFTTMVAAMQAAEDPNGFTADSAQNVKDEIDVLVDGLKTVVFGLSLDELGLGIRASMTAVEDSELAKRAKSVRTTDGPMFTGVLGGDYVAAFSVLQNPDVIAEPFAQMDSIIAAFEEESGVPGEQLRSVITVLEALYRLTTGVRGTVVTLDEGQDGVLAASMVLDTKNSEAWMAAFGRLTDQARGMIPESDPDAQRFAQAVTYEPAKETLGGTPVGQFRIDLANAGIPDMDADVLSGVNKIVGKDGVTLRVGAVSGDTVVMAFGGGATYMTKVIEQAKSKASPLDDDPGIKKLSAALPKERGGLFFVSVDHGAKLFHNIGKAMGESFPFQLPAINAPLTIATTGGDQWSRFDLVIPTELVVAIKNAAMMAAVQPAAVPQQPAVGAD